MREKEVRELYEAYRQVHQLDEAEVENDPYTNPETGNPHTYASRQAALRRKAEEIRKSKRKKNVKEEVEAWVNALVEEGYDLSEYTWDDMCEMYLDEGRTTNLRALGRESARRREDRERGRPETESEIHGRLMLGKFRPGASQEERAEGGRQRLKDRGKVPKKGGKDMFEHVLEYLVAEGYADTNENALVIMANMSEEWRQSILEQNAIVTTGTSTNAAGEKIPWTHRAEPSGRRTVEDKFGKRELREPRLKGV